MKTISAQKAQLTREIKVLKEHYGDVKASYNSPFSAQFLHGERVTLTTVANARFELKQAMDKRNELEHISTMKFLKRHLKQG